MNCSDLGGPDDPGRKTSADGGGPEQLPRRLSEDVVDCTASGDSLTNPSPARVLMYARRGGDWDRLACLLAVFAALLHEPMYDR